MEQRVKSLEERLSNLERQVSRLHDALLGTLDGKPGALAIMQRVQETVEEHSRDMKNMLAGLETFKMDRAKVVGVVLGVSAFWGVLIAVLKFYLK